MVQLLGRSLSASDQLIGAVGIAAAITALALSPRDPAAWLGAAVAVVLSWLAIIDLHEHRLPNAIVFRLALAVVAGLLLVALIDQDAQRAFDAGVIGAVVAVVLAIVALGGGLGMGDAKLSGPLAATLALFGTDALVVAAITAVAVAGVYVVIRGSRTRTLAFRLPFGPSMMFGFLCGLLGAVAA